MKYIEVHFSFSSGEDSDVGGSMDSWEGTTLEVWGAVETIGSLEEDSPPPHPLKKSREKPAPIPKSQNG